MATREDDSKIFSSTHLRRSALVRAVTLFIDLYIKQVKSPL